MDFQALELLKKIPLLTKDNWQCWKWKMRLILEQLGWWFIVQTDFSAIADGNNLLDENSFSTIDRNVRTMLVLHTDDSILSVILNIRPEEDFKTSHQLWTCLVDHFRSGRDVQQSNHCEQRLASKVIMDASRDKKSDEKSTDSDSKGEREKVSEKDQKISKHSSTISNDGEIKVENDISTDPFQPSTNHYDSSMVSYDLSQWYIMRRFASRNQLENVSKFYIFSQRYLALIWLNDSVWLTDFRSSWIKKMNQFENRRITKVAMGSYHIAILTDQNSVFRLDGCNCHDVEYKKIDAVHVQNQIIDIACGMDHILMLDQRGKVWGWGLNESKQIIYREPLQLRIHSPVIIDSPILVNADVKQIACTAKGSVLLTANNQQIYFQGAFKASSGTWTCVSLQDYSSKPIKAISGGYNCFVALSQDGQVFLYQIDYGIKRSPRLNKMAIITDNIERGYSTCLEDLFILVSADDKHNNQDSDRDEKNRYAKIHIFDAISPNQLFRMNTTTKLGYISQLYNQYSLYPITPTITQAPDTWIEPLDGFDNPKNKDFTFRVFKHHGQFRNIYCRKDVLVKHSEYFRKILKETTCEIDVRHHSYVAFYSYIRFIYHGKLGPMDEFHLSELYKIADEFQDEKFRKALKKYTFNAK